MMSETVLQFVTQSLTVVPGLHTSWKPTTFHETCVHVLANQILMDRTLDLGKSFNADQHRRILDTTLCCAFREKWLSTDHEYRLQWINFPGVKDILHQISPVPASDDKTDRDALDAKWNVKASGVWLESMYTIRLDI